MSSPIQCHHFLDHVIRNPDLPVHDSGTLKTFGIQIFGFSYTDMQRAKNPREINASDLAMKLVDTWHKTEPDGTMDDLFQAMTSADMSMEDIRNFIRRMAQYQPCSAWCLPGKYTNDFSYNTNRLAQNTLKCARSGTITYIQTGSTGSLPSKLTNT